MTHMRHCDNCGRSVADVYLFTEDNARWLSAEYRKGYGEQGGYQSVRLDFCGWDCLASYAMSKALDPEVAG